MSPEAAGTQRADRDGVSVTRSLADTEGPRRGTRCWVAVEGISERSERGEQATRGRAPAGQKKSRHTVKKEDARSQPAGQQKSLTQ